MSGLNRKTQYALLAVMDLAAHYECGRCIKIQQIVERTGAPEKYLGQILLLLKGRLLVRSARGPEGGYELMRPPETVRVAEVLEAVSPRRKDSEQLAGRAPYAGALQWLGERLDGARQEVLSTTTLADLLARIEPGN